MEPENLPPFLQSSVQNSIVDRRVGFGRRLGAKLLDSLIVLIIAIVLYYGLGQELQSTLDQMVRKAVIESGTDVSVLDGESLDLAMSMAKLFIIVGISGIVVSLTELFFGASPGKMLLSMQIAYEDGRKGKVSLWAKRWTIVNSASLLSLLGSVTGIALVASLSNFLSFVILVGCFLVLSERRQALHDRVVKSAVYMDKDVW